MMHYNLSASETVAWHRGERESVKQHARSCAVLKGTRFCRLVSYAGNELETIEVSR